MLDFKPICADDYKLASPIMKKYGFNSTESSFVILYMWSNLYNTEMCIDGETVCIRSGKGDDTAYLMPYGRDIKTAMSKIYDTETKEHGRAPRFLSLTEEMREIIEEAYPGEFEFTERRRSFDYIYSRESLATLAGKKLHQKRNHFNKFLKAYEGRFQYSNMTEADIPDVLAFQKKWIGMVSDKEGMNVLEYETTAIERLLNHFAEFELRGGVLRVDGEVCAYCIGSKISDNAVDVMVEKGDYAYAGVYQAINKMFAQNACSDVTFINREEDMGIEGLRHAKLSYNPVCLLKKYGAIWKR